MKRANFEPILDKKDFLERTNSKPIETFVPHQAMELRELMSRFEKGQRLNVHSNFAPGSNFTQGSIYEEDFEDAPPDFIHDITDVKEVYDAHIEHKKDYSQRQKEKKAKSTKETSTEKTEPTTPPDPAK